MNYSKEFSDDSQKFVNKYYTYCGSHTYEVGQTAKVYYEKWTRTQ